MSGFAYLEMKNISKSYDGTRALKKVDFSAESGEVHAIVGENGAGKSTLVKILTGAVGKDEGSISIAGNETPIENPLDAQRLGIRAVHQHFSLIAHLSVTENILIGNLPKTKQGVRIDWPMAHKMAQSVLDKIGFGELDGRRQVSELSVSQKQVVEIAKAVSKKPRILIMDEPSAVLSQTELDKLFEILRSLKSEGVLILYISHRLDEIFQIADRVTVLKDGCYVGTLLTAETNKPTLIRMMVGRTIEEIISKRTVSFDTEILAVHNLKRKGVFNNVNFSIFQGEILGFYGLVGSGRTEVARCLYGADPLTSGEIVVRGRPSHINSPHRAIQEGISMLTEDRNFDGLVQFLPIRDNICLSSMKKMSKWGVLNKRIQNSTVASMMRKLGIKAENASVPVKSLSGGNQQKVVFAKWLILETPLLILDEPTRGVDVATKQEIYTIIRGLADSGISIMLISSELPEVLGLSDRIVVMREGSVVGEFTRNDATEEKLLACAAGVAAEYGR